MISFNSIIAIDEQSILLEAEETDPWPDEDGYVSFSISANDRRSVIHINMDYFSPPLLLTQQDAEDYFEKINYPELSPACSDDEIFTERVLFIIGQSIARYVLQEQRKSI